METKEAIEKLSNPVLYSKDDYANEEVLIELDTLEAGDIISLLQQGEKDKYLLNHRIKRNKVLEARIEALKVENVELKAYKQMLEDIRLECNDTLIEYPKNKITYSFNIIFKMFKQKYFPKKGGGGENSWTRLK